MKLKLLIGWFVVLVVLHVANARLNETPRYMEGSPSTSTPASGEVRQEFTVGFLPVT